MNDRFKFRAYVKANDEIEMVDEITYDAWEVYGKPFFVVGGVGREEKEIILMQCTGLKDKNGKLIYEGDIVRKTVFIDYQGDGTYQPDVYVDREYIGVVHFSASNGATLQKLIILETESPHDPKKQRNKRECPKATKLAAYRSEVIGNIYENPELLKECE